MCRPSRTKMQLFSLDGLGALASPTENKIKIKSLEF